MSTTNCEAATSSSTTTTCCLSSRVNTARRQYPIRIRAICLLSASLTLLRSSSCEARRRRSACQPWQPEIVAQYYGHVFASDCYHEVEYGEYKMGNTAVISDVPAAYRPYVSRYRTTTTSSSSSSSASKPMSIRPSRSPSLNRSILQIVQQRASQRLQLANQLFQRRRQTLQNAVQTLTDTARARHLGNTAGSKLEVCAATVRGRIPVVLPRGRARARTAHGAGWRGEVVTSDVKPHTSSTAILTEEERRALLEKTSKLLDSVRTALSREDLWETLTEKDGVKVWRTYADVKNLPSSDSTITTVQQAADGATVKSETYLPAPPSTVFQLYTNNARVHEYNDNCVQLQDIEYLDDAEETKINWCATGKFGPFKARDFVTLVHQRRMGVEEEGGGYLAVAANVEHEKLPEVEGYVRSQIQLSATFMRPVPGDPHKTHFIQMTQVGQLGGVADSAVAKRITQSLSEKAPVEFVRKFNLALKRPYAGSNTENGRRVLAVGEDLPFAGVGGLSEV